MTQKVLMLFCLLWYDDFYIDETIVRDHQYDDLKCGASGSSHRVFDLRGNDARIENCKRECAKNEKCVAFSGVWRQWCIGCDIVLTEQHLDAISFKKKGKLLFDISGLALQSIIL